MEEGLTAAGLFLIGPRVLGNTRKEYILKSSPPSGAHDLGAEAASKGPWGENYTQRRGQKLRE